MQSPNARVVGWVAAAAVVAALGAAQTAEAAPTYTLTDLGAMGPDDLAGARDVNAAGQVAGWNDPGSPDGAYVWSNGTAYGLDSAPPSETSAQGISATGAVAGTWTPPGGHGAALWTDSDNDGLADSGGFQNLGALASGDDAYANDINAANQVVGFSNLTPGGSVDHAFLHTAGQMIDLGTLGGTDSTALGINDAAVVVGQAWTPTEPHAFAWKDANTNNVSDPGEMIDLGVPAGSPYSLANDVNNAGDAVGLAFPAVPIFWPAGANGLPDPAGITVLPLPGGTSGDALGINDAGQVVGWFITDNQGQPELHAFLYDRAADQMHDLNDLLTGAPGWTLWQATAVNDAGVIVGWGNVGGENRAFLLTPEPAEVIPEPATGALFVLVCGAAVVRLRRRNP